jgi:D-serine deaminase-like pyridoxal phosphate-dependent protein
VWRSAVQTAEQALAVVAAVQESSHVKLAGLMGYEAQIAGIADAKPGSAFMNGLMRFLKRQSQPQVTARRQAVVAAVQVAGVTLRFVNGGGSGSLQSSGAETAVTELTAGSAFYAPGLFTNYTDYEYYPAAGYAIQIVRQPRPDIYTCLGGGYIASGDAGADRLPQPFLPTGAKLMPFEGAGEVQTPIRYDGPVQLELGDPIFMRHAKAGELCEHFNQLLLIANDQIVDTVNTYRGEGCNFL